MYFKKSNLSFNSVKLKLITQNQFDAKPSKHKRCAINKIITDTTKKLTFSVNKKL